MTLLGPYQLLEPLGRGSFAEVWRAREAHGGREVALKLLVPVAEGGDEARRRFLREAELAGKLDHPGIVRVLGRGESNGRLWIAMELVQGETLLQRSERAGRPLAASERATLVEAVHQVALALDHAHRAGVLHRDVKPSNVLLGADGRARLTDFGLARDPAVTQLTREGQVLGTPAYMAPEAVAGKAAGPAGDLYALGATLYHLLAGRPPFDGDAPWRVALRVLNETPAPLASLAPDCPPALARAVARAMAREPAARHATAAELAAELRRALDAQPAAAATAPLAHPHAPGSRLGRHVIEGELGRGGMGVVLRGRDPELGRAVALKRCLGGPAQVARMRREAALAARLWHPGIAPVYEIAEDAQGTPFIVMQLVEGQPLSALLKAGPLEPRRSAELVAALADAVAHAHAQGVVHRDLKPSNVMITASGAPVVLDFGLARGLEAAPGQGQLTEAGELLGTPGYMAPEQLDDASAAGEPADVYGLGAILYECLAGQPPFSGASALKLLLQKLESDPPPPRSVNPAIPPALDALCRRCLARVPAARPAGAAALRDELRAFLARPPAGRRPVALAAPLLGLAGLVGAVLVLMLRGGPTAPFPSGPAPAPIASSAWSYTDALARACDGALRVRRTLGDPRGKLANDPGPLTLSADRRRALVGVNPWWKDAPGIVHLLELPSARELLAWRAHDRGVTGLLFAGAERRAISAGRDGVVRAWDLLDPAAPTAELDLGAPVAALVRAGDGRAIVAWGSSLGLLAGDDGGRLELRATFDAGGPVATVLPLPGPTPFVVAGGQAFLLHPDGRRELLAGDATGLHPGSPTSEGGVYGAAASADGRWAVVVGNDGGRGCGTWPAARSTSPRSRAFTRSLASRTGGPRSASTARWGSSTWPAASQEPAGACGAGGS